MTHNRSTRSLQLIFALLLLVQSVAPGVVATHFGDQHVTLPADPQIPESPVAEPGIPPVDRRLQEISQTLQTINETTMSTYDTVNQTFRGVEATRPSQPLQLFFDGTGTTETGPDASVGGQGGWATFGTDTWRRGAKAARTGESGFTSATLADGTYVGGAHSMLLTPSLDLRAGFADPSFRSSYTLLAPLFVELDPTLAQANTSGESLLSISGVYAALWYNLEHQILNPPPNNVCGGPCWQTGLHADNPGDALYQFEFHSRFNLASQQDFVRMYVFRGSAPPKFAPSPATCTSMIAPSCTLVHPTEGYARAGPPSALDGAQAFTGSTGWNSYHIDLTHWAESDRPIWIGFVLDTENYASPKRFLNPGLFPPDSKFFGFELDDLRLTVPSPPASVRVRPVHEPSFHVPGDPTPIVPLEQAFVVAADIVNTGQNHFRVRPIVEIRGIPNNTQVFRQPVPESRLAPGAIMHVNMVVPGLTEGAYEVTVFGGRVRSSSEPFGNEEADPADDTARLVIRAQAISNIAFGRLAASERSIERGDTQTFTLQVSNVGTLDQPVELLADVVNVADGTVLPDSAGMLSINEQLQEATVPAQGASTFTWHVKGALVGQFALFVREPNAAPFDPKDLDDPFLAPIRASFRPDLETVPAANDDLGASAAKWIGVPHIPIPNADQRVQAYLQAINNEENLYVAVTHHNVCSASCVDYGNIVSAYFDDLADAVATHNGEDGFIHSAGGAHDLRWNQTAVSWELGPDEVGWIRTYKDTANERSTTVFARPLNSTVDGGLTARAGQAVGVMLNLRAGNTAYGFPQGATPIDGNSLIPADGSLSDEMRAWRRIDLAAEEANAVKETRFLSGGFGVDRGPAAIYEADFSDCHSTAGWAQTGRTTGSVVDAWNCATYAPDGQVHVFSGRRPGTCLETVECDPYNVVGNISGFGGPSRSDLISPPITIDADSDPFLSIYHQYGSNMRIDDAKRGRGDRYYSVFQNMRVHIQLWDPETNSWTNPILLEPVNGYDTEVSAGIYDPLAGPRPVEARHDEDDPMPECHTLVDETSGALSNPNPRCGWWAPSGSHPFQRTTGKDVEGATHSGSEWVRHTVPLFGAPFGDPSFVDPSGKTIRLVFTNARAGPPNPDYPEPPPDFGWRIGGIVVTDEPAATRDLAVRDLDLGVMPYDARALGLGPGTSVSVNVTIENVGRLDEPRPNVVLRGHEATSGMLLCQTFVAISTPLQAGESRNVTLSCQLPAAAAGVVRFSAAVGGASGDDFPKDNLRIGRESFAIETVPNLSLSLDSSAKAGRARTDRIIDLVVVNKGNQPLSDFIVRRTIEVEVDGAEPDLLESRAWRFLGTLGVGERRSILDPALEPEAPIDEGHTHFTPPLPGKYLVTARADAQDDAHAIDDSAKLLLTADVQLYLDDFDHPRQSDPTVVQPGLTPTAPDGQWAPAPVGNLGTKALLAGDELTGELPAGTNASYLLPTLDLATAKSASLTFTHNYELEASYDGGRVEISTDGGETWRPLIPTPNALAGRPNGYPDLPMVGANPLVEGASHGSALAFTGRSADFSDAVDGWTKLTFDLSQDPDMRRPAEFDTFDLSDFEATPTLVSVQDGVVQLRSKSWEFDEAGAVTNQRYWWIDNHPAPLSGDKMWWSGSYGEHPGGTPVDTALRLEIPTPESPGNDPRPLWLRWWDQRAGHADGAGMLGMTGGELTVRILESDEDEDGLPDGLENKIGLDRADNDTDDDGFEDGVEFYSGTDPASAASKPTLRADGLTHEWIKRMEAIGQSSISGKTSDHDADGLSNYDEMAWGTLPRDSDTDDDGTSDGIEVNVAHTSPLVAPNVYTDEVRDNGWTLHRMDADRSWGAIIAEFGYVSNPATGADIQANRGVFLDAAQGVQGAVDADGRIFSPTPVTDLQDVNQADLENWAPRIRTGSVVWSVVSAGALDIEPGWNPATTASVPGTGPGRVWSFTADNVQGYPHNADTRLVTPVIDLTASNGADATLRFDHRYHFETLSTPSSRQCISECFTIAADGGTIEYQVQDPATGLFGPWRQLARDEAGLPDGLLFERDGVGGDRFFGAAEAERLESSGYTALELRDPGDIGVALCAHAATAHGYSFERFVGHLEKLDGSPVDGAMVCPWLERPYSLVFSGDSKGWQHEEWMIPHLAGQKVRFAFHAASNPTHVSTGTALLGWQVANVVVAGSIFEGKEAQVRFRVGTDASLLKGSWAIDDVSLVGDLYERLAVLEASSGRNTRAVPDSFVHIYANLTNFGRDARSNLAFAVGGASLTDVEILAPTGPLIPAAQLPEGFSVAKGPLELFAGGQSGSRIPVHLRVRAPAAGAETAIRVALLEKSGALYDLPLNDVPGTTQDVWRVEGFSQTVLTPVPPQPKSGAPLMLQVPAVALLDTPLTLTSKVRNEGTTTPTVSALWIIDEVLQKGNPSVQPKTEEVKVERSRSTESLGALLPDAELSSMITYTPTKAGLYRASVRYLADGVTVTSPVEFEFLVGMDGSFHRVDFGVDDAAAKGWRDASPPPEERYGGSPDQIRFRQSGGQFLWGVSDEQLRDGFDYCGFGGCNYAVATQVGDVVGLEGIAVSPIVDLSRVPQGEAILSINHGFAFTGPGDGARLEAIPYDPATLTNAAPTPAFFCLDAEGNQFPQSFILTPDEPMTGRVTSLESVTLPPPDTSDNAGGATFIVPRRWNALAGGPPASVTAFGGAPVVERTDRFRLSQDPTAVCADPIIDPPEGFNLVNYPVRFILHAATQPGASFPGYVRVGSQGWRINSLSVSTSGVSSDPADLTIPLIDGTRKEFRLQVTNEGQIADRIRVKVDAARSTLPNLTWIELPLSEVELGPGQSALIPYRIEIPTTASLSRGTYMVSLIAQSQLDPNVFSSSLQRIVLRPNPLPDLSVQLSLGSGNLDGGLEEGTVVPVFASVFNLGEADASPVRMLVMATDESDGSELEIGSANVPALCAPARARTGLCLGPTTVPVFVEWSTPLKPGPYTIKARIDPDARLVEEALANNVATMPVLVTPIRRPDVAVIGIDVDAGPDGIADEGELVKVTTRVTNLGAQTAQGVNVQVLMGSTQLLDRRVEAIPTNVVVNLTASLLTTRGEFVVKAIAFTDGTGGSDPNPSNNEFKRILRVRSHDLSAGPTTNLTGSPGETIDARLTLTNKGNTLERVTGELDNATATLGWRVGMAPLPLIIPPGATGDVNLVVEIPEDARAGVHRVVVNFTEQRTGTSLVGSVLMVRVLALAGTPEIALENASFEPGPHQVLFTVRSHSNVNENVTLRLLEPTWGDRSNKTKAPARENVSIPLLVNIPVVTAPGMYNLTVEAVGDQGRSLNRTNVSLTVLPHLDSGFTWVSAERTDGPSPSDHVLKLVLDVRNGGNVPFGFRLVPPAMGNTPSVPFIDATAVPAGETRRVKWSLTVPASISTATLEAVQAFVQTSANQSSLAALLAIPDLATLPNLVMDGPIVQAAPDATPGDRVRVEVPIRNTGASLMESGRVLAHLDGVLVDVATFADLAPNGETKVVFDWVAPAAGDHLLLFVVEGKGHALESTSTDNSASIPLHVGKAPLPDKIAHMVPAPGPLLALAVLGLLACSRVRRRQT